MIVNEVHIKVYVCGGGRDEIYGTTDVRTVGGMYGRDSNGVLRTKRYRHFDESANRTITSLNKCARAFKTFTFYDNAASPCVVP